MKEPQLKGIRVEDLAAREGKSLNELMRRSGFSGKTPESGWKDAHWAPFRSKLREMARKHGCDEVITWAIGAKTPPEVIKHWVGVCVQAGMRQRPMAIAAKLRAAGVFCRTLDVTALTGDTRYPGELSDVYRGMWSDGHV